MKLRNPRDFAAAITQIRSALGEAACAEIVGRSASLIRKWSDPDHPALPNIAQALLLDSAFVAPDRDHRRILILVGVRRADGVPGRARKLFGMSPKLAGAIPT